MQINKVDDSLKISGDVDIATANEFKDAIEDEIKTGKKEIKLDLTDMDYIDSTGLGILIEIQKSSLGPDQKILLINPKRSIRKLMDLTGVSKILDFVL